MLGIIGDIHGNINTLEALVKETAPYDDMKACIQVGDFGVSPKTIVEWAANGRGMAKPTYFIDGNHENFEYLHSMTEVTEILPNLFWVPRGTVLKLDNRIVAFMGGGASIDKQWQIDSGMNTWDPRENILPTEVLRLYENLEAMGNPPVDLLVTHVPPLSVTDKHFDSGAKLHFGVPIDWTDTNMIVVETIWNRFNKCSMVCGHMHRKLQFDTNSFILDIYEFRGV